MHVVVVESPAKAKTVGKYLGSEYRVFASYGHVSDLPAKDGSTGGSLTIEVKARASEASSLTLKHSSSLEPRLPSAGQYVAMTSTATSRQSDAKCPMTSHLNLKFVA